MNTSASVRWSYLPFCSKPFHIWHLRNLCLCEAEEAWGVHVVGRVSALNLVKGPKSCAETIACLLHLGKPQTLPPSQGRNSIRSLRGPFSVTWQHRPQESVDFLTDVFPESFPRIFCFYCWVPELVSCGNGTGMQKTHQDIYSSSVTLHCIKIQNVKILI